MCTCQCAAGVRTGAHEKLAQVIREYQGKPGALIPVLQAAQSIFGYLPADVLRTISEGLGEPYSRVYGVVTFYSFFSRVPRGKYVIRVCLGTACYVRGGKAVLEALEQALNITVGQTTADRLFSLDVGRCFGACGLAPAMMINDDVHQFVKPEQIRDILAHYRNQPAD
jgi:NADH:ubiquinone oxidoreductase subunit E